MKRAGFTMIELIVVIVIIGILAVMALPKFANVKNLAKINSELSSVGGLDSPIMAEIEIQSKRFGNIQVNWHEYDEMNNTMEDDREQHYKNINKNKSVLSKISKRSRNFRIVGFKAIDNTGNATYDDGLFCDAIAFEVEASKSKTGAKYPVDVPGDDVQNEPDKNDFWIFNTSSIDLKITSTDIANSPIVPTVVEAGEIKLIDVNGTLSLGSMTHVGVSGFTSNTATVSNFSAVTE